MKSDKSASGTVESWQVQLLGVLSVRRGSVELNRFRTQKTGALLAYLAFHRDRKAARETLVGLLWPDCDEAAGRNSLSVALSALRRELEPPDTAPGSVLFADRFTVRLNSDTFTTDVAQFEDALYEAEASAGAEHVAALTRAVELYSGRLLPGFAEDWITPEARRLEEAFFRGLRRLIVQLKKDGEIARAVRFAERGVSVDPRREEARRDLIQLYAGTGQRSAARRQFQDLERLLHAEGAIVSATTRAIMDEIERRAQAPIPARPETPAPIAETLPAPPVHQQPAVIPAVEAPQTPAATVESAPPPAPGRTPGPEPKTSSAARLPVQLTRFFGRETEIARLVEMLRLPEIRLITLTGPGGSGKTRLSLESARHFADYFDGTPYFVPLADLQDARLLPEAVIDALRGREATSSPGAGSSLDKLCELLESSPTLLVLDNFEQLVGEGAGFVRTLLERVPSLKILVSSRQRLNVRGEREFLVLPLPTPRALPVHHDTPEALVQYGSVKLFVDRAQGVRPDFELTRLNAPFIAQLCRRLDGIPLAIELAAARSKVLTPAQMLSRLEENLDLLATSHKDVEARHRSLRATMAWSYESLSAELRTFWARLGVFRGGWTLEAAEEVCAEPFALEYLEQLQEASLVVGEESSPESSQDCEMRFRLLETLREFALEQLEDGERTRAEARYAVFYERLAADAADALVGPGQSMWLRRLECEQDNFRAVLKRLMEIHPLQALRFSISLSAFWEMHGHYAEGRNWLERALEKTDSPADVSSDPQSELDRARALCSAGWLAYYQMDLGVTRDCNAKSLAMFRRLNDRRGMAHALAGLAASEMFGANFDEGRSFATEALSTFRRMESVAERVSVLPALSTIGVIVAHIADLELGHALSTEMLPLAREVDDKLSLARILLNLGQVAWLSGEHAEGRQHLLESVALFRETNEPYFGSYAVWLMAELSRREGRLQEACAWCRECCAIVSKYRINIAVPYSLETYGLIAATEGRLERATRLLGAANGVRTARSAPMTWFVAPVVERGVAELRASMSEQAFVAAWDAGQSLSPEAALSEAVDDGTDEESGDA